MDWGTLRRFGVLSNKTSKYFHIERVEGAGQKKSEKGSRSRRYIGEREP